MQPYPERQLYALAVLHISLLLAETPFTDSEMGPKQ